MDGPFAQLLVYMTRTAEQRSFYDPAAPAFGELSR
jgi:hypothetical protein